MTKEDLVKKLSEETDLSQKDCLSVVNGLVEVIKKETKKGEEVKITGFGKFYKTSLKSRNCRNPKTGKTVKSKARDFLRFKGSKVIFE
jgi:DNA-binding protein HU-beta